jgi:hypothetical protein
VGVGWLGKGRAVSDERDDTLDALARAHGADPEELRREISRFRLALDADLTIAAAAADEGAPTVAADVLAAQAGGLPDFERRLRTRVAGVVRRRPATRRPRAPRRRMAAIATAAMLGVAGGAAVAATAVGHSGSAPAAATPSSSAVDPAQALAVSQADTLTYAAEHRLPTPTILAASGALRTTLLPLLAQAPHDRTLAAQLRSLLTTQRTALSSVASPDAQVAAAIGSTDSLLAQLAAGDVAATATAEPPPSAQVPAADAPPTNTPGPTSVPSGPTPGPSLSVAKPAVTTSRLASTG